MSATISPPANKGLVTLNRELFRKSLDLVALRVPASTCRRAMVELKGGPLLELPRLRAIIEDPEEIAKGADKKAVRRLVLLNPEVVTSKDALPPAVDEFAKKEGAEVTRYKLDLDYDYWTADQVLRSILPDELEVPGAFESVGHIAHLNLRDQHIPYKSIIGQVLLDKNKNLRTIVNKTGNIDHTFRFFQMELLAGENNMMAELKEGDCRFRFDFSRVYWNSRLQAEHNRIVKAFRPGQLICDVFAGVGPYALPAAKKKNCIVFANDLNPASHQYLCENVRLNKVEHLVRPYNMDGREFIRQSLKDLNTPSVWRELESKAPPPKKPKTTKAASNDALDSSTKPHTETAPEVKENGKGPVGEEPVFRWFDHYIMNLPATAIEFLDAFRGFLYGRQDLVSNDRLPMIHCHCFSREVDARADVIKRVESVIGASLGDNVELVHDVRNVAPNKEMLCISFRLPAEVAFATPVDSNSDINKRPSSEPIQISEKKARVEESPIP
ncbi:tRNA (guanine) methyltransferase [Spizellomyces punctatus DAOM BR117]|uniref:tRNA (guanine(37)-N1)-methyltransferase n=1 Tax=Spizellomyces punctatus (strain DAOM BR117) TaxID=645134 RepID=A0A0L0HUW7_SPIPD|nr:tRNA (guanine) methyltransferase [Spizellomyces punctatus DAOM BR117]KND04892.1 hypothetical protein SPPG_00589 [Spizellomyces punctatus DAOM BR117]|eukprot:XP_016612931.1 hypothetical protein SPPG_00589 [Spizellomyces punctatus DAOM BR117]